VLHRRTHSTSPHNSDRRKSNCCTSSVPFSFFPTLRSHSGLYSSLAPIKCPSLLTPHSLVRLLSSLTHIPHLTRPRRYHGDWLGPNIHFLGHAGCIRIRLKEQVIRIIGSSGIRKAGDYRKGAFSPYFFFFFLTM
jgi:hypothetical protein